MTQRMKNALCSWKLRNECPSPFPHLETWSSCSLSSDVFTSERLGYSLFCAHRTPVHTSIFSLLIEFYDDLFKPLSLPLGCGLLKGRQSVWLTIYFYLLAQSLTHDGPVLNELLLPTVSHPSCSQPLLSWMHSDQHFFKLALVRINGLFYILKSRGHILSLHLNCSISNMWHSKSPLLPETLFSHCFWSTMLSVLHLSHWLLLLSFLWWFLLLPLSSSVQAS